MNSPPRQNRPSRPLGQQRHRDRTSAHCTGALDDAAHAHELVEVSDARQLLTAWIQRTSSAKPEHGGGLPSTVVVEQRKTARREGNRPANNFTGTIQ